MLQLDEIVEPHVGVVEAVAQDLVVHAAHQRDVTRGIGAAAGLQSLHQRAQCSVRGLRTRRWSPGLQSLHAPRCRLERRDRATCRDLADAGQQLQQPEPAHLVARVLGNAQECQHVLHMRGFEELDAAPFLERDATRTELDLEIGAHVPGAHEHRDLVQPQIVGLDEFQQPVAGECRLRLLIACRDQPRQLARPIVDAAQLLAKSFRRLREHGVRRVEDRLRAAVVAVQRDDGGTGKLVREVEDVAHRRATERIDALRIIADHGHVAMRRGESAHNARLQHVRVLVFVHQQMVVLGANAVTQHVRLEHCGPEQQQVVVVDEVARRLPLHVLGEHARDVGKVPHVLRISVAQQRLHGTIGVDVAAVQRLQRLLLRKTSLARAKTQGRARQLHQVLGVRLVEDREPFTDAGMLPKLAQCLVCRRVKGAPRYTTPLLASEPFHA